MCFRGYLGVPGGSVVRKFACHCKGHQRCGCDPWVRRIPWRRKWQPTPVFLPIESHGQSEPGGQRPTGSPRVTRLSEETTTEMWSPLSTSLPFALPSRPQAATICSLFLWIWLLQVLHTSGIRWYVSLCDWLIPQLLVLGAHASRSLCQNFLPLSG